MGAATRPGGVKIVAGGAQQPRADDPPAAAIVALPEALTRPAGRPVTRLIGPVILCLAAAGTGVLAVASGLLP